MIVIDLHELIKKYLVELRNIIKIGGSGLTKERIFLPKVYKLKVEKVEIPLPDVYKLYPETLRYLLSIEIYDDSSISYMFGKMLMKRWGAEMTETMKRNIELMTDRGLKFPEKEIKQYYGFCCRVAGADWSDIGKVLSAARENYNTTKTNFNERRNKIVYNAFSHLPEKGIIKIITDLVNF